MRDIVIRHPPLSVIFMSSTPNGTISFYVFVVRLGVLQDSIPCVQEAGDVA